MGAIIFSSVLLAALTAALPSPGQLRHVVHEKRSISGRWVPTDRVHPDAIIPLRIGLTQSDLHTGMDRLMDVSHPSSSNYGKFLSAEEVHELFKPAEDVVQQVKDWLLSAGIEESDIVHSDNKGWLAVDLPAHQAESLMQTKYTLYDHAGKGVTSMGCEEYSVPEHLSAHIGKAMMCRPSRGVGPN